MLYHIMKVSGSIILNILDDTSNQATEILVNLNMVGILQDQMVVLIKAQPNEQWSEAFCSLIILVSQVVASGPIYADQIIRGTSLVENLFEATIFKAGQHKNKIDQEVIFDLTTLLQNLVKIENDECLDKIIDIGIIDVIMTILVQKKYGKYVTKTVIECLRELFDPLICDSDKLIDAQQKIIDFDCKGDGGLEILEQIAYGDENDNIKEEAQNLLEDFFGYEDDFHELIQESQVENQINSFSPQTITTQ